MISQRILTAAFVGGLGTLAAPTHAHAQALPTPSQLISGLDLECYRTPGPSLDITLNLTHLNPVLLAMGAGTHQVTIRELAQTCVPVRKNNGGPVAAAFPFVRQVDFACYRLEAAPLANPVPLALTHLNPVLANLPQHQVVLRRPAQLCLPVGKNGVLPPPAVLALVQYIDLECYEADGAHPQFGVGLTQLNPQLLGILPHPMALTQAPRQLCVPVRKGQQQIPEQILNIVRWIDLEKFAAVQPVQIAPVPVELNHLNPMFDHQPAVDVVLETANSLMVPVRKNNGFPPN